MVPKLVTLGQQCKKQARDTGYQIKLALLVVKYFIEVLVLWKEVILMLILFYWLRLHQPANDDQKKPTYDSEKGAAVNTVAQVSV
jgi:hypothetical protein